MRTSCARCSPRRSRSSSASSLAYEPKRILSEVFTQAGKPFPKALIQRLSRTNLSALWKLPVLQPLERFLLGGAQAQHPGNPA